MSLIATLTSSTALSAVSGISTYVNLISATAKLVTELPDALSSIYELGENAVSTVTDLVAKVEAAYEAAVEAGSSKLEAAWAAAKAMSEDSNIAASWEEIQAAIEACTDGSATKKETVLAVLKAMLSAAGIDWDTWSEKLSELIDLIVDTYNSSEETADA